MHFFGTIATISALAFTKTTFAAVAVTQEFCDDVTHSDGAVEQICATMEATSPSIAFENGELTYVGGYTVKYSYTGQYDGVEFLAEWSDSADTTCTAYVNDVECSSCYHRVKNGEDQIRLDCRNIPDGRRYGQYQSMALESMFFPLDG